MSLIKHIRKPPATRRRAKGKGYCGMPSVGKENIEGWNGGNLPAKVKRRRG
jgi:hypothetical protein